MAVPEAANNQITDAVTQVHGKAETNAHVVAMANMFQAMASLYQATAQALKNAVHDATTAQQQNDITAQAATVIGVATLYSIDTAATGIATEELPKQQK